MADLRIDELAHVAGTTVRNVRAYQERGLLPAPRREGRVALYSEAHLARLQLIGRLLSRGYTVANIGELLAAWQRGRDLADVLGLEQAVSSFWSAGSSVAMSYAEVVEVLGGYDGKQADLVARLAGSGLAAEEGDVLRIPNRWLLGAVGELVAAGIPLDDILEVVEHALTAVDDIARHFVHVVLRVVTGGREPGWMPSAEEIGPLGDLLRRIDRLAGAGAVTVLTDALEHHVGDAVGGYVAGLLPHLGADIASSRTGGATVTDPG